MTEIGRNPKKRALKSKTKSSYWGNETIDCKNSNDYKISAHKGNKNL